MSLRENRTVQAVAQIVLILVLVGIVLVLIDLRNERTEDAATTEAVTEILADACGAATFNELREQGLLAECKLAQRGELPDRIPGEALPTAPGDPPVPDVIPDPDTPTAPTDARPDTSQIADAVADYFTNNPLPSAQYQQAISRAVEQYLSANPAPAGEPGRPGEAPTQGEVRDAVRTVLVANPPTDGTDGSPGVGIAMASLDGCDVVFTYTDGTSDRVGPLCGPKGEPGPPPTDEQVAAAVAAYCAANGECRGPAGPAGQPGTPGVVAVSDACAGDGGFITDVGLTYNPDTKTITVTCASTPGNGGNDGGAATGNQ